MGGVRWTGEELDILRRYYPEEGSATAERLLRRSRSSVYSKASRLGIEFKRLSFTERFWGKVRIPHGGFGCWEWQGATYPKGYGCFNYNPPDNYTVGAHRVAWMLANDVENLPDGDELEVCHACDNPPCVNPNHLWIGTHRDNMHDAIEKDRWDPAAHPQCGSDNPRAKLSKDDVRQLKAEYENHTRKYIAEKYDIHPMTVSRIANGQRWSHLE